MSDSAVAARAPHVLNHHPLSQIQDFEPQHTAEAFWRSMTVVQHKPQAGLLDEVHTVEPSGHKPWAVNKFSIVIELMDNGHLRLVVALHHRA